MPAADVDERFQDAAFDDLERYSRHARVLLGELVSVGVDVHGLEGGVEQPRDGGGAREHGAGPRRGVDRCDDLGHGLITFQWSSSGVQMVRVP